MENSTKIKHKHTRVRKRCSREAGGLSGWGVGAENCFGPGTPCRGGQTNWALDALQVQGQEQGSALPSGVWGPDPAQIPCRDRSRCPVSLPGYVVLCRLRGPLQRQEQGSAHPLVVWGPALALGASDRSRCLVSLTGCSVLSWL